MEDAEITKASSDELGHFMLARVPPGEHRCVARTRGGGEAEATLTVPGGSVDLIVGAMGASPRSTGT